MVLRIRLGRDQGTSRCLTAHFNRWKTGSDFAIGLISSPRWEKDTERKRRPSNDRVAGNKTEKKTVFSTPRSGGTARGLRLPPACRQRDLNPASPGRTSTNGQGQGCGGSDVRSRHPQETGRIRIGRLLSMIRNVWLVPGRVKHDVFSRMAAMACGSPRHSFAVPPAGRLSVARDRNDAWSFGKN